MLKTRTWITLGVGLIVLMFIAFFVLLSWPQPPPSPEDIAKRGLEAPKKRSFNFARDWFDQGFDALAEWDENPFGIQDSWIGGHLSELKASKDPKDQAEYQRLLELARKWHENLLSRYPELRVAYRDVPDDRNALKLLFDLQKRLLNEDGSSSFKMSDDLKVMLNNKQPLDPKAAQAWLDANRAVVDELRAIGLMPESSMKGVDASLFGIGIHIDGNNALLMDARLAAERGDLAASMESVQAAVGLANHLRDSDAPHLLHTMVAGAMLSQARSIVFESILPSLPAGQADLAAWESLLNPTVQTPADFARTMKGEWNGMMQNELLPIFADPAESRAPADADLMVEAYTSYFARITQLNAPLALTDLPSHPNPEFDTSGLTWRSRQLTEGLQESQLRYFWERHQINTGLTQAAFAILKGQPVPNDPIYGQPYTWNPKTRELSPPNGPQFSRLGKIRIKLPKL